MIFIQLVLFTVHRLIKVSTVTGRVWRQTSRIDKKIFSRCAKAFSALFYIVRRWRARGKSWECIIDKKMKIVERDFECHWKLNSVDLRRLLQIQFNVIVCQLREEKSEIYIAFLLSLSFSIWIELDEKLFQSKILAEEKSIECRVWQRFIEFFLTVDRTERHERQEKM